MGKDADSGQTAGRQAFDTDGFLKGLDAIFDAHQGATKAEPYLLQAASQAREAGDDGGLLTVLNEIMGFYRSHGQHDKNQRIVQEALDLATHMGLEGSEAWTTTLINAATSLRAGHQYDRAENLYRQALDSSAQTLGPRDRRLAALHNNLSMLYSDTGRPEQAQTELEEALAILAASSTNAQEDLDLASTHSNLALVLLDLARQTDDSGQQDDDLRQAQDHVAKALAIYRAGHLEHSAHFASALAGDAQVAFSCGDFAHAVGSYRQSLAVIEECYGKDTDYWRITKQNLDQAVAAAAQAGQALPEGNPATTPPPSEADAIAAGSHSNPSTAAATASNPSQRHPDRPDISGLRLAKAYWEEYGKPLIASKYPEYQGRIAAGLVGHGSECYGFDDRYSQDHDFGPGFCLWLTDEDYQAIGPQLQADYEALPQEFMGFGPRESTTRAQGAGRRVGVFSIGDFFEGLTGYRQAPPEDRPYEWLLMDEPTLAAASNGQIFADPLGAFSKRRQGFKLIPEDVRLSLISKRLGMAAQAGQYNLPRMWKRGDGAAAWLSIQEFTKAVSSLVFLINQPISVGYMPYYKWLFAALRRISERMAAVLPDVCERLETILRLSSAACFGGVSFGEGGKGAQPAQEQISQLVEGICADIVRELMREGLTPSNEVFLEWQRPYIEEHIGSPDPSLHSL
ncbi:hypothetical protein CRD60_05775 [Bifidobacterium aemilianum]|uniref:DUF4037 domain-containing protein n=1 Tax=Bifidobacterium aemilianum TaxID=2493120 RepID=A0A366K8L7_9BIFI|nr:DUF4037 domain-containing protein [Bifidobacterium aemilianum]RBP97508.1 hypothetical protein CRD60_05775 [Bifidobacterium aemilianum]